MRGRTSRRSARSSMKRRSQPAADAAAAAAAAGTSFTCAARGTQQSDHHVTEVQARPTGAVLQ